MYSKDLPYNDLPDLTSFAIQLDQQGQSLLLQASRALADLNARVFSLANPRLLIDSLVLQEAKESAEIENILTTQVELYRALVVPPQQHLPEVKEVMAYKQALYAGIRSMQEKPLSTNPIIAVHSELMNGKYGIRKVPGTRIMNGATQEVIYTPPVGEDVIRHKLDGMFKFMHSADLPHDPLVRLAMLHYQFEAIHPFTDGNGRTGRILNILYLIHAGLLHEPVLYLSAFFLAHKHEYYTRLRAVTERGEMEAWIKYVLAGIAATAASSVGRVLDIQLAKQKMLPPMQKVLGSRFSAEIIDHVFFLPYCTIHSLMAQLGISYQTARSYLDDLADAKLLSKRKVGKQNYYENAKLLTVLSKPLFT